MSGTLNGFKIFLLVLCCWSATLSSYAVSRNRGDLPMQELVAKSDEIVIGTVKSKQVHVVGRHFETDYEVEVQESLKGKKAAPGQSLKLTVAGGSLTTPPLTQYVQGTASMVHGEKVFLFLNTKPVQQGADAKRRLNPKSKLPTTPRIVGMSQGKFSIIKDEASGQEKVTRFNLEDYGIAPNDLALQKGLRALETKELRSADGEIIQPSAISKPCFSPNCLSPHHGHATNAQKAQVNANGNQAVNAAAQGGPVPVQDLQQFKDQVRKFAN